MGAAEVPSDWPRTPRPHVYSRRQLLANAAIAGDMNGWLNYLAPVLMVSAMPMETLLQIKWQC
jgi:hypothetical protein